MWTKLLFVVAALGLAAGWGARVARAEDIVGLSLRPTEAMPGEKARGSVDIMKAEGEGNYTVKVDLSAAAEGMDLAKFDDAAAWVVWAVDMDGMRHNLGALDDELMLKDAAVDFLVAKLYVTAEKDADAANPAGEPLFSVALRSVEEVDAPAGAESKPVAQAGGAVTAAATEKATAAATASPEATSAAPATADKAGAKPDKLPTTGNPVQDVMVLLLVAAALLFGGWRLRAVRL